MEILHRVSNTTISGSLYIMFNRMSLCFEVPKQFKCVAKSDVLQTVALNVPRYAATLALYILITQACSDFYNFSSLSYYGNINIIKVFAIN